LHYLFGERYETVRTLYIQLNVVLLNCLLLPPLVLKEVIQLLKQFLNEAVRNDSLIYLVGRSSRSKTTVPDVPVLYPMYIFHTLLITVMISSFLPTTADVVFAVGKPIPQSVLALTNLFTRRNHFLSASD
jgi:hypothetical protein